MWEAVASAESAEAVQPAPVGAVVPEDLMVNNVEGEAVSLRSHLTGPTVLVVYRGGWCPFCTQQLSGLGAIHKQLAESGVNLLGLSPDGPEAFKATKEKFKLGYTLLGDPQQEAIARFGLRFQLDAKTTKKYKQYKLPLVADENGAFHLPVPAVYVLDASGTVRWSHVDPNFRQRPDVEAITAALAEIKSE